MASPCTGTTSRSPGSRPASQACRSAFATGRPSRTSTDAEREGQGRAQRAHEEGRGHRQGGSARLHQAGGEAGPRSLLAPAGKQPELPLRVGQVLRTGLADKGLLFEAYEPVAGDLEVHLHRKYVV